MGLGVALAARSGLGADGDYRSAASGNWNAVGTWEVESGGSWTAAAATPTSANGLITIRNGHTVTATANVSVDQTVVEAGGQVAVNSGITLTIANGTGTDMTVSGVLRNSGTVTTTGTLAFGAGGKYEHALNGGAIPTATWDATSTCEVTGVTSTLPTASSFNQAFGHFTWNCAGQTAILNLLGNLQTINGNFQMLSTGMGSLRLSTGTAALNVAGDVILAAGTLDMINQSTYTYYSAIHVGGNLTIGASASVTETGSTGQGRFTFNGSGVQYLTNSGAIANTIHFAVNGGSTLYLGTNPVTGSGTFTNSAGATLGIGDAGGIAASGATGNIRVTGNRSYSASANYLYNGTEAQAAGNGLTAANNLTITNSAGVALSSWVTVTNSLALAAGNLSIGANTLTLNGAIDKTAGGLAGGASANIVIGGSGAATTLPAVELNNLTVNRAAGIALGGAVSAGGTLTLTSGAVTSANNLTMGNGATISRATGSLDAAPTFGTSVNVAYVAGGVATGPELPTATSVLNNLTFSHTSGTVTLNADTTVNGNLVTTAGGTLDLNGYTLTVKGSVTNGGTITGGGKLLLAGSSAQTLAGTGAYGNVELDNAAGASLAANTTINGNLDVTVGQFTVGAYSITVTGATTVDGTLAIASATGTATFNDVTVHGTWNNTANEAVTINGNLVNAGTFNAGTGIHTLAGTSKTIGGTVAIPSLTITGTYTNNDVLTINTRIGGAGGLIQAAGATLNLGGTATNATLTATAAGNTVNYFGAAQTVKATAYENLVLGGSGVKTLTSVSTVNGNLTMDGTASATTATGLTIGGDLQIGDGTTFTAAGYALTVAGATTVGEGTSGVLNISSATGTKIFNGAVAINAGGTWNSGTSPATFRGGIANGGSFTSGSGAQTFDTNNQALAGIFTMPNVAVTGIALTNTGTLTASTALTGTGELVQGAGATLNLGATAANLTIATLTATAADNTVNYSGTTQTIKATDYQHLTTSGSGTKTLGGDTDVAGDLTLGSGTTLDASTGNYALTLAGDWLNNGATFTARSGTVTLDGTGIQSIGGTTAATFNNLTLANAAGAELGASQTVSGTLTLTSGTLAVGANTLTLNGPPIAGTPGNLATTSGSSLAFGGNATGVEVPASVLELNNLALGNTNGLALNSSPGINTLTFSANGKIATGTHALAITNTANSAITGASSARYVVGNLSKTFAAGSGQSFTYPIGDADAYRPVVLASMNVGTAGSLVVGGAGGDHAELAAAGIDASRSVNRVWSLVPVDGLALTYNATFNYLAGDVDGGVAAAQFVVRRYTSPDTWAATTISGTPTTTATTIAGETGFGDFAIGNQAGRTVTFTTQPADATAGAIISPAVQVTVTDTLGVGVPSASVTVALTSGSGTLSGTLTQTANASGVATFNNLSINLTGDKQLTATSGGQSGCSSLFHVNPAAANKLVIAQQPSATATAGVVFAQQPVIRIEDVYGNLRTNDTLVINAARLGGAGTLLGTTNLAAVGGIATFTDLAHPLVSDITIRFTNGTFAVTSTTVSVSAGPFAKLQILMPGETAAPGTATGKTGAPSVRTAGLVYTATVYAVDACWNLINTVTDTVGLTCTDPNTQLPAEAALAAGVKTFLVTNKTAGTWTLTATDLTDGGKAANVSSAFTVYPGAATQLQVLLPGETAAPGTPTGKAGAPDEQTAGVAWTATVNAVDAFWNVAYSAHVVSNDTTDANDVRPANASLVAGTKAFVFTNNTAGTWTLTATDRTTPYLTAYTSAEFVVRPGPFVKMQLLVPGETAAPGTTTGKTGTPAAQTAGTPLNVTVNAVDANWNVVSAVADMAGIASTDANAALPANAALSGGTQTFQVTFKTAGSWTLTASDVADGGKTANTSPNIAVGAGALAKLQTLLPGETAAPGTPTGKTGTPNNQTAGASFSVVIRAVDDNWNLVSTTHTVGLTSSDGAAALPANGALSAGSRTVAMTNRTAGIQTATAADITQPSLPGNLSAEYLVVPAAANKLVIAQQPSATATAGVVFAQQPVIRVEDAYGNLRSNDTPTVTATRSAGTVPLLGTTNAAAVEGVATYADLFHPRAETITIVFSASGLASATSTSVAVDAGPFTQLQVLLPGETAAPGTAFGKTEAPSARTAGLVYTAMVYAVDAWWNLVNTATDTVGLACTDANAALPAATALADGAATLVVTNRTAGTWTLTATDLTDGGKAANVSSAFTVYSGAATQLQVLLPGETAAPGTPTGKTGAPDEQTAGVAWTATVNAVDACWNVAYSTHVVSNDTTDANDARPANASLVAGTKTFVFTNNTAGTWTLTANDRTTPYLTAYTSAEFVVRPGPFVKMQLLVPGETAAPGTTTGKTGTPTVQTAGTPLNVTVNAVDANWNVVPAVADVAGIASTDANAALPANAALSGGTQTYEVTFKTAGSWTLTASDVTDGGKTANTSPTIAVGAGTLAKLQTLLPGETAAPGTPTGKTGTPNNQTAGASFSVVIRAVDDNWNLVSTTHTVGLTSTDGAAVLPANGALSAGSRTVAMTNRTAGTRTATASDITQPAIPAGVSEDYLVVPAAANKLVIAQQPSATATAGVVFAQQPVIRVEDAYGNLRSNDTPTVTATRGTGTVPLLGTTNVAAVGGVATYADLFHPKAETITIVFSASGLASATSTSVAVDAGPFTQLQVLLPGETAAPGTTTGKTGTPTARTAGTAFNVAVNAVDAWWNLVNTATDTVGFACTDANAALPADTTFVDGAATLVVTNRTAGTWTLTATDLTAGGKTPNTSPAYTVNPATRTKLQVLMPGETAAPGTATGKTGTPDMQTAGVGFTVTVYSVDANWNYAGGSAYSVRLDTTDSNDGLPTGYQSSTGTWSFIVTNKTAGSWTATATVLYNYLTSGTGTEYMAVAGPFDKLQLLVPGETAAPGTTTGKTGTPAAQTAGAPLNVTVNAVDAFWNVVPTVADVAGIASSDANAALPADAALSGGTQTYEVTFKTAGNWTLTASDVADGGKTANTSPTIAVGAGALAKLQTLLPGETAAPGTPTGKTGAPNSQTAGASFSVVIRAVDDNWNLVSTTHTVGLTSSDGAAALPANGALSAGSRTVAMTNRTAGIQTVTAADITQPSLPGNLSAEYLVVPAAANKLVIAQQPADTATAGEAFAQQPVVWVVDAYGNLRSNDTPTVTARRGTGTASIPLQGTTNAAAVEGVATYADLGYTKAEPITIVFSASGLASTTSTSVSVSAGAFTKLQVLLWGETWAPGTVTGKTGTPAAKQAGNASTATVYAVDAWWNLVNMAADTVGLACTDPNTLLPADAALVAGAKPFVFTNRTAGSWTVTATDLEDSGKTPATSAPFQVNANTLAKLQVLMPGETAAPGTQTGKTGTSTTQTAGAGFTVTVNSVDAYWNPVSCTYTVSIDTTDPYDVRPANAALVAGTRNFVVTNKTAGTWTLTADEVSPNYIASDTGSPYEVAPGTPVKLQILVPGETAAPGTTNGKSGTPTAQTAGTPFNVTVNAVDAFWNVVPSVTDTIAITTTDPNAVLSSNAALGGGTGTFEVAFRTAGGTRTVTASDATDPGKAPSTSAAITVNTGPFEKLLLVLPGETMAPGTPTGRTGSPNAQTAGVIFTAKVYAVDANWNSIGTNNTVGLLASDPAAQLPANAAMTNGNRTFVLTNRTAGQQFLVATNVTRPAIANGISSSYAVLPAAANRLAIQTQPSATALTGVPFVQQPVVRIEDVFGNLRSNDTATIAAARLAGAGDLLGTTNLPAVGGLAAFTDLAHPLATNITVRFTSGTLGAATSTPISVGAATFSKLQVLVPGETPAPGTPTGKSGVPETQSVEIPFTATVRAVDDNWNLIASVTDTVALASSDASATLPSAAALAGGVGTFSVTMNAAGNWTVTATDETDGTKTPGTSSEVTVIDSMLQQFFLPMPEAHIRTAFLTISADTTYPVGTNMVAIFSIVVSVPGTVIIYDQWEDGYEGNINNPTNAGSQIWGDGNDLNGVCPGFANDPAVLAAGMVIALRNNVGIPRTNAVVKWDGGDRISASRPITVTRSCWSLSRGPVHGSSVEVHSTLSHGLNFIAPLGDNVAANGMFTYAGLTVMADQDNTKVIIDVDGTNTVAPTTNVINRGYFGALFVNDGIKKGATVKADKPIQVHMITGDPSATFESRSFVLHPREIWSANYIFPIATVNATYPGRAYLFNTNPAPLTVAYSNRTTSGTLTIPGTNGVLAYDLPLNEGTMFASSNGPFYAVGIMGCVNSGSGDSAYDWALTPLTLESLTTEAVCGWGPGDANQPPVDNGNPVWVMPMAATTVYVDFNGDRAGAVTDPMGGQCDVATNLATLQMQRFFDPDKDQSGLRVYTLDGTLIAAAWGEDPSQVEGSNPFLDMGYALVPIPKPVLAKTSTLAVDGVPAGPSLDDELEYEIRLDNKSLQALFDVVVRDVLPPQVKYVAGTAVMIQTNKGTWSSTPMTDDVVGTPFPLDGDGYSVLTIPAGGAAIFRFRARIDGSGCITNLAYADDLWVPDVVCVSTPTTIRGTVWVDLDGDGAHDGAETVGLPNVKVVLCDGAGAPIATNWTDAAGFYSFSGTNVAALAAGTYAVVETDPDGYLSTGDADGTNDNRVAVTIAAAETRNDVDFLDTRPGTMAGTVSLDLDGDGWRDAEDTNGLAGVAVVLCNASTVEVAAAVTAADGGFRFTNVFPGAYVLVETDPAGYISTGDAAGSNDNAIAVALVSGTDATNNYFMDALPGSLAGTSCDGDGDGFFNPATDTPLAFVAITLRHAGPDGEFDTADDIVRATETGLDGAYLFAAIPPGAYAVRESPVASYAYLDLADADGGNPNEIILTLAMGEDRVHQDFENTHWLGIPGVVYNAAVLSSNEFIWTDKASEQRIENTNSPNADIRELRMFANASNFYVRVKMNDITDERLAYVAIGLDTRRDAGSAALDWLGDDSGLGIGGDYYDPPAATHRPVRNIVVHRVGDSARAELFAFDGYAWYPPPSGWSAAIISTNNNSLELRIPRADLLLDGTVTGRFTVASFLNSGRWANEGDSTVAAYPGTPDAADSVSIAPYQVNDGRLDVTAWREDLSDFDVDFWLDVRFDGNGIVDNQLPTAPTALAPADDAEVGARPTLAWSAASDADGRVTSYFLEVATNANFNGAVGTENGLIDLRVNLPATQTNYVLSTAATQYWWQVRARDNAGMLSAGTIQSFRIGGKTDVEGPVPTLLYVGTNLAGFLAGQFDEYVARYGYIQSVSDGDVAAGNRLDFAIRWEDPSGVFATNWMHAEAGANAGQFTWNILPENGRVSPNWDAGETNVQTGGGSNWVQDRVFWGSNVAAVGNSAQMLTNWAYGAFTVPGYDENAEYYLYVSAEDDCRQNGYPWAAGSWASYGDPDETWGGYAADGPNSARNVTTDHPLRIAVQDDDVQPPIAATGQGWANSRSLLASNATAALSVSGAGQAAVYAAYDGGLLVDGLTLLCNAYDEYSGMQVDPAGPATTNTSLAIGFGPRFAANCTNFSPALSHLAEATADTAVVAWQWAALSTGEVAELWGGEGTGVAGATNPVRLTLWDNDHDRPNDQAVASNVVFGYVQVLDDDMVGPRMKNFLTMGRPGALIATGFEDVDGWETHAAGAWSEEALDGVWQAAGAEIAVSPGPANERNSALLGVVDAALQLPPLDRPGWLILWARLRAPGESRFVLERWNGTAWDGLGQRTVATTNYAEISWTVAGAASNEILRLRLAEQVVGTSALEFDQLVVAPNREWTNAPVPLAWSVADDLPTGGSGIGEYRVVDLGSPAPVQVADGATVGLGLATNSVPTPAAQGAVTGYVFAVDADEDRGLADRAMGMVVPHVQRIDLTPPTVVHMGIGGTNAVTETVDDPTTQFDLTWIAANIGPDDPMHPNHPTGLETDRYLLSPWRSYKIYYGTYDPLVVPLDDNPSSETTGYVYTNFLATKAYTNWSSVTADTPIEDPSAAHFQPNYQALTNPAQNHIRLYDLDYDQDYVVVVVGLDEAGNEGPAGVYSWATNNTIRFALIRGSTMAKCDAASAFPGADSLCRTNVCKAAALYWIAAGPTNEQGIYTQVKRDYDLIGWDACRFQERSNNVWQLVGTVRTNWFVDDGGAFRGRGQMRFYRAAYKDRWRTTNQTGQMQRPLASEEVYAMHNVVLSRGQNFVALHGEPYVNTFRGVFGGTENLPGGSSALPAAGATIVEFYSSGTNAVSSDQYWLHTNGHWFAVGGGDVTVVMQPPDFFTRGFSITLPDPLPTNYVHTAALDSNQVDSQGRPVSVPAMIWSPILKVPTNAFSQTIYTGHRSDRGATVMYNLAVLRLPVAAHPSEMRLLESGFVKGERGFGDEIYTINTATKTVLNGYTIYCDADGVWRNVQGNGLVQAGYFKPNDIIVIVSRAGEPGGSWTWTYHPTNFYNLPTRWMGQ